MEDKEKKFGWPKKKKFVYLDRYEDEMKTVTDRLTKIEDKNILFYILTGISVVALVLAIVK